VKILILDDDPFVLKLLSIQLKAFGLRQRGYLELVSCEYGNQAVQLLESDADSVGLVFCDLQMPEMDGVEFVRHLVRLGYRGHLVLVSGEDERVLQAAEQLARAHGLNILGALHKPVFPEQLRQMLDAALPVAPASPTPRASLPVYTPQELRHAMDAGQLVNFYQPKVDLQSGEAVGAEALVRWRHPDDGMVPPMSFIPMAEEFGLINDLGRLVLARALRDAAAWHAAGHPLHVAVNVSMGSLGSLDFPDFLVSEAAAVGLPPDKVVLEITESRLLEEPAAQLDVLTRLRLKQVSLSIDDFGTGYSCLAHLRDLPFAEVKIDRGFVHGAARDPALQAILDTSLGLARQLRMKTVAEGIEDIDDWNFLRQSGCQLAQGYLIAKPMPVDELEAWLKAWPSRHVELFG